MSTRRRALTSMALLVSAGLGAAGPARAATPPPELARLWPQARLQGQATMRVWGLHIADLQLWLPRAWTEASRAPSDASASSAAPPLPAELALELRYARGFSGASIAQRSLDEMRRAGPVDDAQAQRFFGIWLGHGSSMPALRRQLLGAAA